MNSRQKLVQQQFLNNEEKVINRLKWVYNKSVQDVNDTIKNLQFKIDELQTEYDWLDGNDPEKEKIRSKIQSKIYQKQYQEQLKSQLDGILDRIQAQQFTTVSEYLDECYVDGFIGTVFDAHGQGVPIITPINQEAMVRAVQLESKISVGLYTRLGENIAKLKKRIASQVSRGISSGMSYAQVAQQLEGCSKFGYNRAITIARTEGHRIQTTATMDAMTAAKEKGADVVKQWDSTLDDVTRESHRQVDGEIRELDKPFSNGLDFPGDPEGGPAEVICCRCALLQRARWALDDDELQILKDRAEYYELDKATEFEDFKKKYLKATENPVDKSGGSGIIKNIELPANTSKIRLMSDETRNLISAAFDKINDDYKVALDELVTEPLGVNNKNVPFQFQPIRGKSGELIKRIVINSEYNFMGSQEEFQKRIMRNFNNRILSSNSIDGLIAHEMAHVMTFQDVSTYSGFLLANKSIAKIEVLGISRYADASLDGAEHIAEAFAAKRCGIELSEEAQELIERYIERWKK